MTERLPHPRPIHVAHCTDSLLRKQFLRNPPIATPSKSQSGIQFLHLDIVDRVFERTDRRFYVRRQIRPYQRNRSILGKRMSVMIRHLQSIACDLSVGRIDVRHIDCPVIECLVCEPLFDAARIPVETIGTERPRSAVESLQKRVANDHLLFAMCSADVGDSRNSQLLRALALHRQRIGVVGTKAT